MPKHRRLRVEAVVEDARDHLQVRLHLKVGARRVADVAGALYWPCERLLAVADGMDSPMLAARAPFDLVRERLGMPVFSEAGKTPPEICEHAMQVCADKLPPLIVEGVQQAECWLLASGLTAAERHALQREEVSVADEA